MYKKHFGLKKKPFELSPDSNILFLGETHKEALAVLKKGVISDKHFLLFTGGVGTGKTTLINVLSHSLENPGYLCVISNPALEIDDFFCYFAEQLGLLFDGNKAKFLFLFSKLLEECRKTKRKVLLIVDEAHVLPTDLLEELRLLVNMAAEMPGALSIFLVGQPELLKRLSEEQLAPLRAKIGVRFNLNQLSEADTLQYVLFRLNRAGAQNSNLFTEQALADIYQATGGNPRLINILCDNALLIAYSNDNLEVDSSDIQECVEQLRLLSNDNVFNLPQKKSFFKRMLGRSFLGCAFMGISAGIYGHSQGWLEPIYQRLAQYFNIG